jgi:hypothetical protein
VRTLQRRPQGPVYLDRIVIARGSSGVELTHVGLVERTPAGKDLLFGDGALATTSANKRDEPVRHSCEAILETGQEREMDDEPQQPADESSYTYPADENDCAEARDRSHRAEVAVAEGSILLVTQPPEDGVRRILTGLHRDLGDTWELVETHEVADHEHLWMSRKCAVGQHGDPPGPVDRDAGLLGEDRP